MTIWKKSFSNFSWWARFESTRVFKSLELFYYYCITQPQVIYAKGDLCDLIVLDPKWLTQTVCGFLLSRDFKTKARPNGCYSVEEFQLAAPSWDAYELLPILESLGMCTQVRKSIQILHRNPQLCVFSLNFSAKMRGILSTSSRASIEQRPSVVYGQLKTNVTMTVSMAGYYSKLFPIPKRSWRSSFHGFKLIFGDIAIAKLAPMLLLTCISGNTAPSIVWVI